MILEHKHKNFKDEYKIKERVKKKINIRRHMSILVALELHYFQELLNWWHSPFNIAEHFLFLLPRIVHDAGRYKIIEADSKFKPFIS